MNIEKMHDFFTKRVKTYDEHMLNVVGCRQGYKKMAALIPPHIKNLLDLGCGTGLELDEIFKVYPDIKVTGTDLTQAMLNELKRKYPNKNLDLICGNHFNIDFGKRIFDVTISFETLHHFNHQQKLTIYKKIYESLISNGAYIECDYRSINQLEENLTLIQRDQFNVKKVWQIGQTAIIVAKKM
ncbi:MAG: class I SAM-dependent methyltransferase [Endomicrobium sp.]|jgi:ubiquinone/menaquinone biosynthesis C-methylase UbiE|nr:class I SAM-dependent methyltransferase [Endomicrobium sp.]